MQKARYMAGVTTRGESASWALDQVDAVAPAYSYDDRLKRHQGKGLFRLTLDLKAGTVTSVFIVKSTGFATLDKSAITSFRQWRWKPGKWRQIVMPVIYVLTFDRSLPKGAIPLEHR